MLSTFLLSIFLLIFRALFKYFEKLIIIVNKFGKVSHHLQGKPATKEKVSYGVATR